MKKLLAILSIFSALTLVMLACGSEEDQKFVTPLSLEGTWVIQNADFMGDKIEGDGSTLTFRDGDRPVKPGADYMASNETSGEFAYSISPDQRYINIIDYSDDGGAYTGKWEVITTRENRIRLSMDSGTYGIMTVTLVK